MPVMVIMPKVDMDMSHGTVSAWHIAEGDAVTKGDALFDIETDKAAMEVEAPATGTLHHIVADAGTVVAIGEPVAWIYAEGEAIGSAPASAKGVGAAKADDVAVPAAPKPDTAPETPSVANSPDVAQGLRATPLARRLGRERGLDLASILGSGPHGRVQARDVPDGIPAELTDTYIPPMPKGGAQLPLVLIHGFASDPASWAKLERELGPERQIIRMELPAHGRNTAPVPRSFADLARDMRAAFDTLFNTLGDVPVHLVGHSLGAAAALSIADVRPRRVARLTLVSPAGLGPEIDGRALTGIVGAARVESLAPWLRTLAHDPDLISDAYVRMVMAQRSDPGLRDAQLALADAVFPDGVQAFDLRAALDRVQMPTRIIWGRADRIIPWQHALGAPGRVSLNLFERTGHIPHIERAAEIAFLLRDGGE